MKKRYIFVSTSFLLVLMIFAFEKIASRLMEKTLVTESDSVVNQIHGYKCLSYADIFCYDHRFGWIRKKGLKFTHSNPDYLIDHEWREMDASGPVVHLSDSKMGALEVAERQSTVSTLTRLTGQNNSNLGHSGYNLLQYYIWAHDLLILKKNSTIKDLVVHVDFYSDITLLDSKIWYCYSPFAWQLYPRFNPSLDSGLTLDKINLPISAARITDYYSNRLAVPKEMSPYIGTSGLAVSASNLLLQRSDLYRLWKRYTTTTDGEKYESCVSNNIRQGGSALHEIFDPIAINPEYWRIAEIILKEFSAIQKSSDVKLTFVLHPDPFWHHSYSQRRFQGLPSFDKTLVEFQYKRLLDLFKKFKLDYIDLRVLFSGVRTRHQHAGIYNELVEQGLFFYRKDTSHMNPYGHALTACAIALKLNRFETPEKKSRCISLMDKNFIDQFFSEDEINKIFVESQAPYTGGDGL